ncbi:MAG: YfiR family protein [Myxococcales bacterium]|nr:YfiR family protein [Myxococcales bacterium]MCB9670437.1 YfiR family protein [Alphaproteobacteria bacterium]
MVGWAPLLFAWLVPDAGASEVRPEHQALLLLKVASYDRNRARTEGEPSFRVLVVHDGRQPNSRLASVDMVAALEALVEKVQVDGAPLEVRSMDGRELARRFAEVQPDVVYVTPGSEVLVPGVLEVAAEHHLTTFTGSEALFDLGIGVGMLASGGKPRLFVNLETVRAEGADFASDFLRVAEVRRQE